MVRAASAPAATHSFTAFGRNHNASNTMIEAMMLQQKRPNMYQTCSWTFIFASTTCVYVMPTRASEISVNASLLYLLETCTITPLLSSLGPDGPNRPRIDAYFFEQIVNAPLCRFAPRGIIQASDPRLPTTSNVSLETSPRP